MRTYTQLTRGQRYQIYALLEGEYTQTEIVKVHKSTISRELRRNRGKRGYRPSQADNLTIQRRVAAHGYALNKPHTSHSLNPTAHCAPSFITTEHDHDESWLSPFMPLRQLPKQTCLTNCTTPILKTILVL